MNGVGTMLWMTEEFQHFLKSSLLGSSFARVALKARGYCSWCPQTGTETGLLAIQAFPAQFLLSCLYAGYFQVLALKWKAP